MPTFSSPRDRMPTDNLCLYTDQKNFKVEYPELKKSIRTPVCIVGAGFAGVMTAYYLAQMGVESVIIERHRVGWGASGRNSGQVIPGFNADPRDLMKTYGEATVKEIYRLNTAAKDNILENIQKIGNKCNFRAGLLIPSLSARAHADQQEYARYMGKTFGYQLQMLSADETAKQLGSSFYHAGMEDMNGGHFNPQKYLNLMAQNAVKTGAAQIFENTPALSVKEADGGVTIQTPYGTIQADKAIIAGGGYLGQLVPQVRKKYVLVRTSMLATQTLDKPIADAILPNHGAVYEWRRLLNYYAKTADGRLIFGGGDSAVFANKKEEQAAFQDIYQDMLEVYPQLKDVHITHWWGGYIAVTKSEMPDLNTLGKNIIYATGFSGHGVVPTHMMAKLMAAMSQDEKMQNPMAALKSMNIPGAGKYDYTLAKLGLLWAKVQDGISA